MSDPKYASRFPPCLLLQNGTEVMKIQFTQYRQEDTIPPEQWASTVAEKLVQ